MLLTENEDPIRTLILEAIHRERERAKELHRPFSNWSMANQAITGERRELFNAMMEDDRIGEHGVIIEAVQLAGTLIKTIENLCTEKEIRSCLS